MLVPDKTYVLTRFVRVPTKCLQFCVLTYANCISNECACFGRCLFVFNNVGIWWGFTSEGPLTIVRDSEVNRRHVERQLKRLNVRVGVLIRDPVDYFLISTSFHITSGLSPRIKVDLPLRTMVRIGGGSNFKAFKRNMTVSDTAFNDQCLNFCLVDIRGGKVVSQFYHFVLIQRNKKVHWLLALQVDNLVSLFTSDQRR